MSMVDLLNGDGLVAAQPLKNDRKQWCPEKDHQHCLEQITIVKVQYDDRITA